MDTHLFIGDNHKTRKSVNFGLETCQPTRWCFAHCYARARSNEEAARLGSTGNSGPITWDRQQACYTRNTEVVKALHAAGDDALQAESARVAASLRRMKLNNIRWNGTGDLFPEVIPLIAHIASRGILVWGFSRKASMIELLATLCTEWGVATRPVFTGSIDATTTKKQGEALVMATENLSGEPRLAYATAEEGMAGRMEIALHPLLRHFKVAFGYHTNNTHTVLNHPLECPATSGEHDEAGYCQVCRRCMS